MPFSAAGTNREHRTGDRLKRYTDSRIASYRPGSLGLNGSAVNQFCLPDWARPGVAIRYLSTDEQYYSATISHFTTTDVVIQTASGKQYPVDPYHFRSGSVVLDSKTHEWWRRQWRGLTSDLISLA